MFFPRLYNQLVNEFIYGLETDMCFDGWAFV